MASERATSSTILLVVLAMQLGEGAILSSYTIVANKVFVKCLCNKKFRTVKRKKEKHKGIYTTSSPSTGYLLSVEIQF